MEKTPADVLEEAADLLLIHGRCRGAFVEGERHCTLGAIAEVLGIDPQRTITESVYVDAVLAIEDHLVRSGHEPRIGYSTVSRWNDKTADDFEVIDTLRAVAKDLRNEAS